MSEKIMNFINDDLTDRFQVKPKKRAVTKPKDCREPHYLDK
jgi:hypothetical protein